LTAADGTGRLAAELVEVVGPEHVLRDPDVVAPYTTDWTRRFSGTTALVVRPADTGQVQTVVDACRRAGIPIVPQGGNTGLVGGGVPRDGEVVLSLTRLDGLEPVDATAAQVTAGAGVTLAALQAHARRAGFAFPLDFAARDSATVGGAIATNAGGIHVLRYGSMRTQVVGVEAVLSDGSLVRRMSGLVKDNAGYHLPSLLAGSEGTLAIITRARLRLVPEATSRVTALLALGSTADALAVFARLRRRLVHLEAAEVFYADGLALVRRHGGASSPFPADHSTYLLVEVAGYDDGVEELAAALADCNDVADAAVADDRPGRERLWRLREGHTEAINADGVPHKLDVTVPVERLAAFERELRPVVAAVDAGARTIVFGHVGDGNLHVNILGPDRDDERCDEAVLRLVADHGGSISAEHGIGTAKARWLDLTRDATDIAAMRSIKDALDPTGLLNPGVLFAAPAPRQPPASLEE
jgi:FAD/FMN-containing dehydrogenase